MHNQSGKYLSITMLFDFWLDLNWSLWVHTSPEFSVLVSLYDWDIKMPAANRKVENGNSPRKMYPFLS